jgi:hypothetical protein
VEIYGMQAIKDIVQIVNDLQIVVVVITDFNRYLSFEEEVTTLICFS